MPLDPGLEAELKKRGLSVPGSAPAQDTGLWDEIKKRGLSVDKPASPETSAGAGLWEGLKRGAQDVLEQGATVGARMMRTGPEEGAGAFDVPAQRQAAAAAVAPALQRSAQAFAQNPAVRQHPIASNIGRVGGNIAAATPLMAVPGASGAGMALGGRALLGAGMGAATGGAPGAVAGGLTGGLGGAIGPRIAPAFQRIAQEFPNLTQMVSGAVGRTGESFQRATANEVLQPIGAAVQRTVKVGHDLINYVGDKLDDAYNKVLPKVTFRAAEPDPATGKSFAQSIPEIAENVPEAHAKNFERIVRRQISNRVDAAGNMSGDQFKSADHEIGRQAARYSASPDADQQEYGDVLRDLQAAMRDTLRLHNPAEAPALAAADKAWARYVRMQEAAGRRVDSNGEFMPNDLLNAVRSTTKGNRNRAFARGDQLMQEFGRAGNDLIGGKPPNLQRIAELAGGGAGAMAGAHIGIGGALAGRDIGRELGHQAGAAVGSAAARLRQTPSARELGAAVSRSAPIAGAGAEDPGRREPYVSSVGP